MKRIKKTFNKIIEKYIKGFTLIELLVVIAIIAILSAIVFVVLSGSKDKANIAAVKQTADSVVRQVQIAQTEGGGIVAPQSTSTGGGPICSSPCTSTETWPSLQKTGYVYKDAVTKTDVSDGNYSFTIEKADNPIEEPSISVSIVGGVATVTEIPPVGGGGGGGGGNPPVSLAIGDTHGGGKIFYILQPGDSGYDANTQHGLIVSAESQTSRIKWANSDSTGFTSKAFGTGVANTDEIIASQGEPKSDYAAGLARSYNGGGYNDWYLPSNDELGKLFLLDVTLIGGFSNPAVYWSSSEDGNRKAWYFYFRKPAGSKNLNSLKTGPGAAGVRAIRSF